MRILFYSTRPPYPPHKGDQLIAYNQIKTLKEINSEVEIIIFSLYSDEKEKNACENEIIKYVTEVKFVRIGKFRLLLNSLKTIFNFKPFQVNAFDSLAIRKE